MKLLFIYFFFLKINTNLIYYVMTPLKFASCIPDNVAGEKINTFSNYFLFSSLSPYIL